MYGNALAPYPITGWILIIHAPPANSTSLHCIRIDLTSFDITNEHTLLPSPDPGPNSVYDLGSSVKSRTPSPSMTLTLVVHTLAYEHGFAESGREPCQSLNSAWAELVWRYLLEVTPPSTRVRSPDRRSKIVLTLVVPLGSWLTSWIPPSAKSWSPAGVYRFGLGLALPTSMAAAAGGGELGHA